MIKSEFFEEWESRQAAEEEVSSPLLVYVVGNRRFWDISPHSVRKLLILQCRRGRPFDTRESTSQGFANSPGAGEGGASTALASTASGQ